MTTPRPVLILSAIAASGAAATGVLSTATGVPGWVTLTVALVTAVATAAGGAWAQGQVTPNAKVATIEPRPNVFVAGDAGPVPKGERVEPPVAAGPSPYRGRDVDLRGDLGERGQITGSLIVVIVLVSAAVAVLVYALAAAL